MIVNTWVAVFGFPFAATTSIVTFFVPATTGTPEIPPLTDSFRPFGSAPSVIDHLYGGCPPLAVSVAENGSPRTAVRSGGDVITTPRKGTVTELEFEVTPFPTGSVPEATAVFVT